MSRKLATPSGSSQKEKGGLFFPEIFRKHVSFLNHDLPPQLAPPRKRKDGPFFPEKYRKYYIFMIYR